MSRLSRDPISSAIGGGFNVQLKQNPVPDRPRLPGRNHPYGGPSLHRAFVFTNAAANASFKIHVGQFDLDLFLVRPGHDGVVKVYGLGRRWAVLFADNAGPVSRPGQASAPIDNGGPDGNGVLDFFFAGDLPDGAGGADIAAKGAGVFAIPLDYDEVGCPETGHPRFAQGGINHIGGKDLDRKSVV